MGEVHCQTANLESYNATLYVLKEINNLFYSDFDGCQYGLQPRFAETHQYLMKPWRFATNIPDILPEFNLLCPSENPNHTHRPVLLIQ